MPPLRDTRCLSHGGGRTVPGGPKQTPAIQTVKSEAGGLIGAPYFGEQWRCVEVAADGLSSDRLTTLHFEPPPASGP
jgi:hypothetical protein